MSEDRGDDLLRVPEVAEELGVTVPAVHRWINQDQLSAVRLRNGKTVRVLRRDLEAFKDRREGQRRLEEGRVGVYEAAGFLKLHPNRIYEMVREGELPYERGTNRRLLFDMDELRRYAGPGEGQAPRSSPIV